MGIHKQTVKCNELHLDGFGLRAPLPLLEKGNQREDGGNCLLLLKIASLLSLSAAVKRSSHMHTHRLAQVLQPWSFSSTRGKKKRATRVENNNWFFDASEFTLDWFNISPNSLIGIQIILQSPAASWITHCFSLCGCHRLCTAAHKNEIGDLIDTIFVISRVHWNCQTSVMKLQWCGDMICCRGTLVVVVRAIFPVVVAPVHHF